MAAARRAIASFFASVIRAAIDQPSRSASSRSSRRPSRCMPLLSLSALLCASPCVVQGNPFTWPV
jgi:hypothetical protein